jgi:hypothetical protein
MAVLLGHTPERTCRPPHRTPALLPRALVAVEGRRGAGLALAIDAVAGTPARARSPRAGRRSEPLDRAARWPKLHATPARGTGRRRSPPLCRAVLVAVAVALRAVIAVGRGEEEKKRG